MESQVTLADLWKRGDTCTVAGPEGSVTVWTQKMSPAEQEEAFRRARARRAVALTAARDKSSDAFQAALSDANDIGDRDAVLSFVVEVDVNRKVAVTEAEVAGEDEWSVDNYLSGLRDAWAGGLKDRYAAEPDDAEAKRVLDAMARFGDQVNERLSVLRDQTRERWAELDDDALYEKAADHLAKLAADEAFNTEYWCCEIWQGTRIHDNDAGPEHPEHATRYFPTRQAVDALSTEAFGEMRVAFRKLEVDTVTGKDSQPSPDSSTSSEPPAQAAADESSGLVAATP